MDNPNFNFQNIPNQPDQNQDHDESSDHHLHHRVNNSNIPQHSSPFHQNTENNNDDDNNYDSDTSQAFCRICRGEATPSEPLYHPCKCRGSIKFVHQDCLQEWIAQSTKPPVCDLCNTPFKFSKGKLLST